MRHLGFAATAVLLLVSVAVLGNVCAGDEVVGLSAFRPAMESRGFVVTWQADERRAVAAKGDMEMSVSPGSEYIAVGENELKMKKPAELIDGHIYIPTETIEEIFADDEG